MRARPPPRAVPHSGVPSAKSSTLRRRVTRRAAIRVTPRADINRRERRKKAAAAEYRKEASRARARFREERYKLFKSSRAGGDPFIFPSALSRVSGMQRRSYIFFQSAPDGMHIHVRRIVGKIKHESSVESCWWRCGRTREMVISRVCGATNVSSSLMIVPRPTRLRCFRRYCIH